jgi:tRNA-Thr(GGU) m(6)t(6)A37 methyltransferase TsaA
MDEVIYRPIGVIHTGFTEKGETPIQSIFAQDAQGEVEVFPAYTAGLKCVDGFSHLILIYHFHLSESFSLLEKPFLDGTEERGIFSIRHFRRPNPIGLSVVRLDKVRGNLLEISEVDIIDGTPLLDIKPFVHQFDNRTNTNSGWVDRQHLEAIKDKSPRALRNEEIY